MERNPVERIMALTLKELRDDAATPTPANNKKAVTALIELLEGDIANLKKWVAKLDGGNENGKDGNNNKK